jgi:hypothetical protein
MASYEHDEAVIENERDASTRHPQIRNAVWHRALGLTHRHIADVVLGGVEVRFEIESSHVLRRDRRKKRPLIEIRCTHERRREES